MCVFTIVCYVEALAHVHMYMYHVSGINTGFFIRRGKF